jgi:hypothetical protein
LCLAVEAKPAVHARNNKIEACEHLVRIIEGTVTQDIALDAFEDAKAPRVFAVGRSISACCAAISSMLSPPA